jgi:PAS domain S-box-containing protein
MFLATDVPYTVAEHSGQPAAAPSRSFSLVSHLALITLLTALPLIILAFLATVQILQTQRETIRETLRGNARALAASVGTEVDTQIAIARVLSLSPTLLSGDVSSFEHEANSIRLNFPGSEIVLSSPDGQQLINTMSAPGEPLPIRRNAEIMARVLATKKLVVSDVYTGRIAGRPMTAIELPVIKNGDPAYVLSVLIPATRFQQLINDQNYPSDWVLGILDSKANFVARIPDPDRVGTPASEEWRNAIKQSAEGLIENNLLEGDAVITAYAATSHGWTAGVALRKTALDAPVKKTLMQLAGAIAASVALSFLLAWLVGRRLSSRASSLRHTALDLARGALVKARSTGVADYDELLRAFAQTSGLLRESSHQRDKFERALVSSGNLLQASVEIAQIAPYEWDPCTDEVKAGPRFNTLWGLSPDAKANSSSLIALVDAKGRHLIRTKIAAALNPAGDGLFFAEFRLSHSTDGKERWLTCRSRTLFADGKAVSVIGAVRDISSRKTYEARILTREKEFRDLADAMPQLVWTADADGELTYYNRKRDDYRTRSGTGMEWQDLIHPDDMASTREAWEKAQLGGQTYEMEHRLMRADGIYAWHLSRALPMRDANGSVTKWYGTATDIDESKQRESYVRVLMGEIAHRSKNMIAVIQAIARQTATTSDGLKEFNEKFSARLQSLAGSQDLLIAQDGTGVYLNDLVNLQLGHFAGLIGTRIFVEGCPIRLEATAAQAIGMALHELSTNAAKYGALSRDEGEIDFRWKIEKAENGEKLSMTWTETGGPKVVPPTRTGLGSMIIQRLAGDRISGTAELQYLPAGIVWHCEADVASIVVK